MSRSKQYLYAADGSYFGHCLIAIAFVFPIVYGIFSRGSIDLNAANVMMYPIGVSLLLGLVTMTESCIMIVADNHLFAYNVDNAVCVPLSQIGLRNAVKEAQRIYGRVFDRDCDNRFSIHPKSSSLRNLFYSLVIVLLGISCVSPFYHFVRAMGTGPISVKLASSLLLIVLDAMIIVNRVFFRASIRRFNASVFGNRSYRAILAFELTGKKPDIGSVEE